MRESVAYPVRILREHITNLEAALSVCLADPDHKPVHKLRTETRRVEALLILIDLVPALPEHRKQAAALLRALRKLRRAAGEVRDLDVHRKMLEQIAEAEDAAETARSAQGGKKSARRSHRGSATPSEGAEAVEEQTAEASQDSAALLSKSAAELRHRMGRERDKAAGALQELLHERQTKISRAAEALLDALQPAEDLAMAGTELLRDAEAVLERNRLLTTRKVQDLDEDELHTVRKAAKAARYVAESLPQDELLTAAAQRFEALQEAGGQWHDALELARAARRFFGKDHALTASYRGERDARLKDYRAALLKAPASEETRTEPAAVLSKGKKGHAGANGAKPTVRSDSRAPAGRSPRKKASRRTA